MPKSSSQAVNSLLIQSIELSTAAPHVIAHRMTSFMLAGVNPSAKTNKEFHMMWSEKNNAFMESWQAMASESMRINQDLTKAMIQNMFTPWWNLSVQNKLSLLKLSTIGVSVLEKGLTPISKKAKSNSKRLKK